MSKIVKAWKSEDYKMQMSDEEREILPENPAGIVELTDEALDDIIAGAAVASNSCCWSSCKAAQ